MTDPDKISQVRAIKAFLQQGYAITDLEALQVFDCRRLSARILDLKCDPHNLPIDDAWVKLPNGKRIKKYFLKKEN